MQLGKFAFYAMRLNCGHASLSLSLFLCKKLPVRICVPASKMLSDDRTENIASFKISVRGAYIAISNFYGEVRQSICLREILFCRMRTGENVAITKIYFAASAFRVERVNVALYI